MPKTNGGAPSPRRRPTKQATLEAAKKAADARAKKAKERRDEHEGFRKRFIDKRLRETIERLGGAAAVERAYGIPHTTISGWLRAREGSTMLNLWRLTRVNGISVDWLCGFEVPRLRSKRDAAGDLRRRLIRVLAERTGYPPALVARVVPSGESLLEQLIDGLDWDLFFHADPEQRKIARNLPGFMAAAVALNETRTKLGIPLR